MCVDCGTFAFAFAFAQINFEFRRRVGDNFDFLDPVPRPQMYSVAGGMAQCMSMELHFRRNRMRVDCYLSCAGSYSYTLKLQKVQYRKRYYRVLYKFRPLGRRITSPGVHNLKEHVQ